MKRSVAGDGDGNHLILLFYLPLDILQAHGQLRVGRVVISRLSLVLAAVFMRSDVGLSGLIAHVCVGPILVAVCNLPCFITYHIYPLRHLVLARRRHLMQWL